MQGQEMSGIEMYDMKDTRIIFFKLKKKKQSLKLSLLVIFTPLINKEVKEGMQICEAGSRLFPLSSLCLRHHAQSWLSGSVMEAPREKTNPMVIILVMFPALS